MTLWEVSQELEKRLCSIFLRDGRWQAGRFSATSEKFQSDEHWRDTSLFNEYFHGDTGRGLGAESSNRMDRADREDPEADRRIFAKKSLNGKKLKRSPNPGHVGLVYQFLIPDPGK